MGFSYLGDKDWNDITRDERTFCMHLYHAFIDRPYDLIKAINTGEELKEKGFNNKLEVKGVNWGISVESCFYRDFLFHHGVKVKGHSDLLEYSWGMISPSKLIKRTFDLCLFSEKEIIIIEAKAFEPLTSEQFRDFVRDKKGEEDEEDEQTGDIQKIFNGLKRNGIADVEAPEIKLVILASSHYFKSPSFNKNGVGKKFIIDDNAADAVVSWKELSTYMKKENIGSLLDLKMIQRADDVYSERITENDKIPDKYKLKK